MKVLILGAGGFLGGRLARALARRGTLRGRPITGLALADLAPPPVPEAPFPVESLKIDIADPASVAAGIAPGTDVIFHLAAIVSAHAEEDLDAGMAVNMAGSLNVFQRCRALGSCPVLVFASSIAVYGGAVPDPLTDATFLNPQTSYGTQKAVAELLLNDYSRRGLVDGRGLRLPSISVRPGRPNRAASAFMSGIFREPLSGQEAICPVGPDFAHFYLGPRRCVENLIRAAELEAAALGQNRCMTMPGRRWTIGQMIAAMTEVAGAAPARLIRWEPQPEVERIVSGWRDDIRADRALALGLTADDSFADNIRQFLEDDLPGGPVLS
ncbi:NAD-dependent dehydratase [Rhodovulum viride]|uniref:NAD-dependent dehydratase n=1 Tax=Rhodovulum viride TaxID=1231134 RepID=A0ABX9DFN1_9RHOB|nr:D-erythronate dehydrogenase [Rhodovulum viride]RAP40191.1 NAD-dependent dehydratase [Rhodovulum viride]